MKANKLKCHVSGKGIISNQRKAKILMDKINGIGVSDVKNFYKCVHCSGYHLTKMSVVEHKKRIREMRKTKSEGKDMNEIISNRLEFLKSKNKVK